MLIPTENFRVSPGTAVDLHRLDARATPGFDAGKKHGKHLHTALNARLEELQELVYVDGSQRVLIVIQAMDTGGKDGTIRHVFDGVNPAGVKVASFKKPTPQELARDYLWRVHAHVPANGEITIFNRSHYEDVLVVRVRSLVPEERWRPRYDHMNQFERMLTDEGTTIVKLFLHISREEQRERLQARVDDPSKNWKFSFGDLEERKLWNDYIQAYEEMLSKTSTQWAPWFIIPADRKWFRNLAVSSILISTLESLDLTYPSPEGDLSGVRVE